MDMTNQEFDRLVKQHAEHSPLKKDLCWAFGVGGGICALGQGLLIFYQRLGASSEDAGTWVTVTLIFLSALLTGLDVYDDIAKRAGAGTLVPVTGFANAIVSPAMEFKSEGVISGMASKMFQIAGPVLVFGIGSSVVYGLILCLMRA